MKSLSHLLQMRGLKLWIETILCRWKRVASFTDAWIETEKGRQTATPTRVASFTDAWIETFLGRCSGL